ncbi:hypothetical protein INR49_023745 [Caranx melampygus]|nr:hypothetical protein INR49_023745 [Caranx melampygus]
MEVLGVVGGTSCPCEQLVVMTCEDKKVYAYDGEVLHLVASGLKQLFDQGMEYPASTNFYRGEAFKIWRTGKRAKNMCGLQVSQCVFLWTAEKRKLTTRGAGKLHPHENNKLPH